MRTLLAVMGILVGGAERRTDSPLLVLLADGCQGSTFVTRLATTLVRVAMIPGAVVTNAGEALKAPNFIKNATTLEDQIDRLRESADAVVLNAQTFNVGAAAAGLSRGSGARIVAMWRSNPLDRAVCEIRDGIHHVGRVGGAAVDCHDAVLDRSGLFSRRRHPRPEEAGCGVKARLDSSRLVQTLEEERGALESISALLDGLASNHSNRGLGVLRSVLTYEALTAYEYDEAGALEASVDAWSALLAGFGHGLPRDAIAARLNATGAGARVRVPHAAVVDNLGEVRAALAGTRYATYLRPPP